MSFFESTAKKGRALGCHLSPIAAFGPTFLKSIASTVASANVPNTFQQQQQGASMVLEQQMLVVCGGWRVERGEKTKEGETESERGNGRKNGGEDKKRSIQGTRYSI